MAAVEAFGPYIKRFKLHKLYDRVYANVASDLLPLEEEFDLVIFGDVLEHMSKEEGTRIWNGFRENAEFLYLSIFCKMPDKAWSVGYAQQLDEWQENRYEQHLHEWAYDEVLALGPFLWQVPLPTVAAMIAEGNLK